MIDPADATPRAHPEAPAAIVPTAAATCGLPGTPDDRAARRAALSDLAAMIGLEVFY